MLLEIPAGASGFRFRAKPVVEVEVVVVAAAAVAAEVAEAAPGGFKLKPSIPAPGAAAVVAGVPRDSPVVVEVVGAVAMETKSEDPALVVAGVGAAGCVAPVPVAAGAAEAKVNPVRAVGWAAPPTEPMLKPEVPVWEVLPPVNENPPGVVEGAEEVVEEPNTKPVGAEVCVEAAVLEMALLRLLLPSPKLPVGAEAGMAAVLPKLSFGVLIPKENPVPPAAGVVVPKLKPVVCVAGACVVTENRLVEGVLVAGWEGAPKLNPPVLDVEKENPEAGVVVAVFAVPNVNPPVGAPVPPKVNPLMAPESGGGSYSGSQRRSSASATAPALSALFFLQPRPPPPPLQPTAMEFSTVALVPVFSQLSILQSLFPAVGAASFIAICTQRLCCSHVTPGDPGAGAGQGPAPS